MAESPAHKFGQIIGNVLEDAIEPRLRQFAEQHNLYLDRKGYRPAREGTKVTWEDKFGNRHDLDYVFERGGTPERIGTPVAFIESAWRRYTKHSRNKAQEIQGAILPLLDTYRNAAPFIGVVLAGVFTEGALNQLQSRGFSILYFPYETVVKAFQKIGIDASSEEETPESEFEEKVRAWEGLRDNQCSQAARWLVRLNSKEVNKFMQSLERAITRKIELIRVLPLYGTSIELNSVQEAITFIENHDENRGSNTLARYEVEIRFNNGDHIRGYFADKRNATDFLRPFLPSE